MSNTTTRRKGIRTYGNYVCYQCGIEFKREPSRVRTERTFCSLPCRAVWNKTLPAHNKGQKASLETRLKQVQNHNNLKGPTHPRWKGGRRVDKSGYQLIWTPNHPNAESQGYVREHRLVAEKYLGRYLLANEVVHHIDQNKKNNDITNLIVLTPHFHMSLHSKLRMKARHK